MRSRPARARPVRSVRLGWRWLLTLTGLALAVLARLLAPVEALAAAHAVLVDAAAVTLTAAVVAWLLTAAARHLGWAR